MVAWVCMIQELYFGPHIMGHHGTWLRGQGQLMENLDMSTENVKKDLITLFHNLAGDDQVPH